MYFKSTQRFHSNASSTFSSELECYCFGMKFSQQDHVLSSCSSANENVLGGVRTFRGEAWLWGKGFPGIQTVKVLSRPYLPLISGLLNPYDEASYLTFPHPWNSELQCFPCHNWLVSPQAMNQTNNSFL